MGQCKSCSNDVPDGSRFCPQCGAQSAFDPATGEAVAGENTPSADSPPEAFGPTVTSPQKRVAAIPAYDSATGTSSDSIDDARFTPGTMLLDRYRIVGLLGKGGMGEVYRADDLKLRQPVALKFLPESLAKNQSRLDRLHHEVRVARQVSHPNVCRVYDIGEADGHPFITMEYVSGEDLASVLRRMGRPSGDKALQIARQICAGLAAAHDKGVLHRDLKPHNIMIDERGRVRITDFGLAGFVEEFSGRDIQAGTPAYMSPEQLSGKEVSVKSDLYSLGLVLFELFTGHRAFSGSSKQELLTHRSETDATTLSTLMDGVDSSVERVILRCLESQPAARPSSAMAVAAALPGGDPLAAALAAGETPDPSMVAAAGGVGGLRPAIAVMLFIGTLLGTFAVITMNNPIQKYVSLEKPPEVLADRAEEIVKQLGYETTIQDRSWKFSRNFEYLKYIEENDKSVSRWEQLRLSRIPSMYFEYRQSPRLLLPAPSEDHVGYFDPPLVVSGMSNVRLSPSGGLLHFLTVPPQQEKEQPQVKSPSPWSLLFELAQFDEGNFKPVESTWNPQVYCDERAAWEGHWPDQPDIPIRIEAGAYRGKPNYFQIIGPWSKASLMGESARPQAFSIFIIFMQIIFWTVVISSIMIARRNLRLKRGDRTGANHLALVYFVLTLISWMLTTTHFPSLIHEFFRFFNLTGLALALSAILWMFYMALEPYIRKHWPHVLISWNRLLAGKWRDPLVGRDILIGAFVGMIMWIIALSENYIMTFFGIPFDVPVHGGMFTKGIRHVLGGVIDPRSIWLSFIILFILFMIRLKLKNQWIAIMITLVIFGVGDFVRLLQISGLGAAVISFVTAFIAYGIGLLVLIRFGLLTMIAGGFLVGLLERHDVSFDFSAWYGDSFMIVLAVFILIVGYSFHTSLAGRSLFKDELLET